MITVEHVSMNFGGIQAVDDCSLEIADGGITGLIGPNGAGKTTLFNMIAGELKPTSGRILLDGRDITGLPPHQLFRLGVTRTFQIPREFHRLTTRENLLMVPRFQHGEWLVEAWFRWQRIREQEREFGRRADEVLEFVGLAHLRDELAGNLSGGQKKLLELARTMMAEPRVVLLDEPAAGVNRTLLATIADDIRRMNEEMGYTFCIIEHDMDLITELCDPVIVMAEGSILTSGPMSKIRQDERVLEAYFGSAAREPAE